MDIHDVADLLSAMGTELKFYDGDLETAAEALREYENLETKADDLTDQVKELEEQVEELQKEIQELKGEADGAV